MPRGHSGLGRFRGKLGRRGVPEQAVRPLVVVVDAPSRQQPRDVGQRGDELDIEVLVPQSTVEALDEAVLRRWLSTDELLTERAAFRPLRNADPTTLLISSFAVSFFLQKLLILLVGSRLKGLDFPPRATRPTEFVGVRLQLLQIVTILISVALLVGLTWFLKATRLGLHMRAAAEDFRMARSPRRSGE